MKTAIGFMVFGFLGALVWAQSAAQPDVSGTWVESTNGAIKWVLAQKDNSLSVQELDRDKVVADFSCKLNGEECAIREDNRPEKIMMYYNGPVLVAIRERGADVIKQRISSTPDGKGLHVETIPLSSDQKSEVLNFQRESNASSSTDSSKSANSTSKAS